MQIAQQETTDQQSTNHSLSTTTIAASFTTTHLTRILRSHHLCHIIESFILLPKPADVWLPTVADCVARLHAVYEASLSTGVYGLVPLLCAYVWRIRSVVDGVAAVEEASTVFEYVRRERKRQREAEVKKEDETLLE